MMPHVRLALVTATFVCLAISASAVEATEAAFGSGDKFKNFISEWKKFWLRRGLR